MISEGYASNIDDVILKSLLYFNSWIEVLIECLACFYLFYHRRKFLNKYISKHGPNLKLLSTASSPILGQPNCLTAINSQNRQAIEAAYAEESLQAGNEKTHQIFLPERTTSPHPRFLGLAKSIYERRTEKVNI